MDANIFNPINPQNQNQNQNRIKDKNVISTANNAHMVKVDDVGVGLGLGPMPKDPNLLNTGRAEYGMQGVNLTKSRSNNNERTSCDDNNNDDNDNEIEGGRLDNHRDREGDIDGLETSVLNLNSISNLPSHPEISISSPSVECGLLSIGMNSLTVQSHTPSVEDSLQEEQIGVGLSTIPNQFCSTREAMALNKLLILSKGELCACGRVCVWERERVR